MKRKKRVEWWVCYWNGNVRDVLPTLKSAKRVLPFCDTHCSIYRVTIEPVPTRARKAGR